MCLTLRGCNPSARRTLSSSNRGGGYFMSAAETGFHAKMKKYDQTLNVWFLGYNSYFGWYYIIRNKFGRKIFQKLYSFYELIFGPLHTSCHMYWTQRQELWSKFSPIWHLLADLKLKWIEENFKPVKTSFNLSQAIHANNQNIEDSVRIQGQHTNITNEDLNQKEFLLYSNIYPFSPRSRKLP